MKPARLAGRPAASVAAAKPAAKPLPNACAICGRPIAAGLLMCLPHWRQVPTAEQAQVWRTWRAFLNRKSPSDGMQRLAAYRQAADAAIACVGDATPSPQPPHAAASSQESNQ